MAGQSEDRRVQRSRQLLREALLALIVEQGYEALTVQEIIDRANVGRATFYAHYRDKQDLLLDVFAGLREIFHVHGAGEERMEEVGLRFFRHAAQHGELYRAMVGKESGALLHAYAHRLLSAELRSHLAQLTPPGMMPSIPLDVAVTYVVSALLALLIWWLDHGMPYTPEQMDVMFRRLALPGLAATYGFDAG